MDDLEQRLLRLVGVLARVDSGWRRAHDLSMNEGLLLLTVVGEGAISPSALGRLLGVTSAGTTSLLDRLEHRGLLDRHRDPDDGRRVVITPTKRALRAGLEFESVIRDMAHVVSPQNASVVNAFLEGAERAAERYIGGAGA